MNEVYRVIWKHLVIENQIAGFVYKAMTRGEKAADITQAMTKIDQLLSANPTDKGESRGSFQRVLIVQPLVISFEVYEDEKIVYITRARYAPRRKK